MAQAAEDDHTEYEGVYTDAVVSAMKPTLAAECYNHMWVATMAHRPET